MNQIDPNAVHEVLGRWTLVDGFDLVFDWDRSKDVGLASDVGGRGVLCYISECGNAT